MKDEDRQWSVRYYSKYPQLSSSLALFIKMREEPSTESLLLLNHSSSTHGNKRCKLRDTGESANNRRKLIFPIEFLRSGSVGTSTVAQ